MYGGDPVDGVAADDGEVRHVDPLAALLLDTRQLLQLLVVVAILLLDSLHVEMVDMIDDLQVPGQKLLHHGHRPPL